MSLFTLVLAIALFGVLLWAINRFLPQDSTVRKILNIVAIGGLIFWLLKEFGVFEILKSIEL